MSTAQPHFVILYVRNPTDSAAFYTRLLGVPPVEAAPGFAMFVLGNGMKLGLWRADEVQPPAQWAQVDPALPGDLTPSGGGGGAATAWGHSFPGGGELVFAEGSRDAVQRLHDAWQAQGLAIVQPPTTLDFGHTFVALDPDGHRLRVYVAEGV